MYYEFGFFTEISAEQHNLKAAGRTFVQFFGGFFNTIGDAAGKPHGSNTYMRDNDSVA